ncbi:PucR family transcriptional regulator [Agromyces sp. NPDC056523]|uniref:PucR family transcriptional regulator n=1 Tax=Agromyces sp. NPDC056523 TaxID=3345850 RepID=UPI00366CC394
MHTTGLSEITRRCLADVDVIAAEYASEVRRLPGYPQAAVADEELYRTAHRTFDLMLRLIGGGEDVRAQLIAHSDGIGQRRARAGLALDSLLRAVRLDFRFIWETLRAHTAESELPTLTGEVVAIWDAVEVHTSHIQSSYIAELTQMNRELELERATLLRRLLVGEADDEAQLQHVASAFGLPIAGRFRVLVGSPRFARQFRRAVTALKLDAIVHSVDGTEVVIIQEHRLGPRGADTLRSVPAGVAPAVDGLVRVGAAWSTARRLAAHVPAEDVAATLDSHWEFLVDEGLGSAAPLFREDRLAELDAMPAPRRAQLVQAVAEYLRSGSVTATADALYLHRNTLLKRLQRFEEATGLDPTLPRDAGTIRVVLGGELELVRPGANRP